MEQSINSQSMLRVGTVLRGIYRIDSYLSSGGFGNTYVATNIEFDERVAIKEFFMKGITQRDDNQTTVSVSNTENRNAFAEQKEKFKKEARRLRQLRNEHIVSVHDLFEENGTAYYVMDFVDGENLSDRMKRMGRPLTEAEVNQLLPQILDALKSVHDANMWHLDLKPANIMVDKSGQVKLIDFGASKQLNAQKGGATTSTAISYTNGYAPREQMEQNYDKFGPWTDLYALGATLYNLLTAQRPPLPTDIDDDMSDDKHLALPMPNANNDMKQLVLSLMQTNRQKRPQKIEDIHLSQDAKPSLVPQEATPTIAVQDDETIVANQKVEQRTESLNRKPTTISTEEDVSMTEEPESIESSKEINEGTKLFDKKKDLFAIIFILAFAYLFTHFVLGNPVNFVDGNPEYLAKNWMGNLWKLGEGISIMALFFLLSIIIYGLKYICIAYNKAFKYAYLYISLTLIWILSMFIPSASKNNDRKISSQEESLKEEYMQGDDSSENIINKHEIVYDIVDQMPSFPGGNKALVDYLNKNTEYPQEALNRGIAGRVLISFVIGITGSVEDVRVVDSVDALLDKEAVRVIQNMPCWNPGKQDGKAVRVKYNIPVSFKLR